MPPSQTLQVPSQGIPLPAHSYYLPFDDTRCVVLHTLSIISMVLYWEKTQTLNLTPP